MNYHSDNWIMQRLNEHYDDLLHLVSNDQIVGVFLQGSQNYGLDYEDSDVDSKAIILPSLDDLIYNKPAVSITHVRDNDEHIDLKDIRLYIQTFKKQNLNFIEILFTKYKIINPKYEKLWNELVKHREEIAWMNSVRAIKSMYGIAMEKVHAFDHEYPSRMKWIEKFGYDPKQLHHLIRIDDFTTNYLNGMTYEECLTPKNGEYLVEVKKGLYKYDEAVRVRDERKEHMTQIYNEYAKDKKDEENIKVRELLDRVQHDIMFKCIKDAIKA